MQKDFLLSEIPEDHKEENLNPEFSHSFTLNELDESRIAPIWPKGEHLQSDPFDFIPNGTNPVSREMGQLLDHPKQALAQKILEQLARKFPHTVNILIFKELNRIIANQEITFIDQRSAQHLSKLAYSIYFVRKKLSKHMALSPFKEIFDVRIFPSFLYFTFGSKPVLSILTHVHLKDKYELFDEEQILFIIRKSIPDVELVKDSIYSFQSIRNNIKTLYFEIHKKNGREFHREEIKALKAVLKQEIKFSIEQLAPRVFMIRNEEEIFKNIFTLSQEIHFISDLPQVMILFDQQTLQEVIFTVIVVKVLKPGEPNLERYFEKKRANAFQYLPDRCRIVRYLRKKYPVQANVFRLKLTKDSSLLRIDRSLNFYLARQKISKILTDAIGEFRDYNGGIIIKQRETLASFREVFREISLKEPDLLENFYYSLSPIEVQATLPLESLKCLFELFLEARNSTFTKPSDSFVKFHHNQKELFISIRITDEKVKNHINALVLSYHSTRQIASFSISVSNTHFLGYLLADVDQETEHQLSKKIMDAIQAWKSKIKSRQILRLALEHPVLSLDPRIGGDETSAVMLKMLFEGLMRINREGKLDHGVAKRVEISEDQRTYLFTLRSTLWSDRSIVTAYDFEYAWKKVLSPNFKTPFAYLFYPIKNAKSAKLGTVAEEEIGIKALNTFTLQVDLEFPSPYFLELTAHSIYSPINRKIDQRHPNWLFEDRSSYVCNVAFQLKKNDPHTGYELVKNPLYWDAANIRLDEIRVVKANRYECYEMFQNGMNDWVGSPLGIWDSSLVLSQNDERIDSRGNIVYWFVFNTNKFPFNCKKVRQALALSFDRAKLEQATHVYPAYSPIPPLNGQNKPLNVSLFQMDRAKKLFKEALKELNLSLEEFPEIPITYLAGPVRQDVAHFIKEEWEKTFGIRCTLESLEWKTLFSKMTQGEYLVGGITWESWIHDSIYTLNAFRDAGELINFPKWENEEYKRIMCLAEREIDLQKRQNYYDQAEAILLDEMPVLPLFLVEASAFKKRNFQVDYSSPLVHFKWGYFIEDVKKEKVGDS